MRNANPTLASSLAAPNWLAARAAVSPHAAALVAEGRHISFGELSAEVHHKAAQLTANGIREGDHVALFLSSSPETVAWIFALWHVGAVIVPLNRRLVGDEIIFQLQNVDCTYLLHDDDLPDGLSQSEVRFLHDETLSASKIYHSVSPAPQHHDHPCLIMHTSGTTGKPKGVVLTHGNLFYSAMASAYRIGVHKNDRWLCVLPLYHIGGLSVLVRSVLYGTTIDLYPQFEVEAIHHALTHDPITMISLVPTMLYRLLKAHHPTWNPAFRLALLGGAAAARDLIEQCLQANIPIATTYGLTEAASQVATALPHEVAQKAGTVGKPLLFSTVRILDENGSPQPAGEYGEIVVQSPVVMQGYYRQAPSNGEIHTGDIGYVDEDGDLWLVQRRSDLIVSGGENVYPSEVEQVLRQHPAVDDVCVVGIPYPEWGQQVAAVIVLRGDGSAEDISAFCRQHLAGYKIPRQIMFVDNLPQNASGKILRHKIAALFETP